MSHHVKRQPAKPVPVAVPPEFAPDGSRNLKHPPQNYLSGAKAAGVPFAPNQFQDRRVISAVNDGLMGIVNSINPLSYAAKAFGYAFGRNELTAANGMPYQPQLPQSSRNPAKAGQPPPSAVPQANGRPDAAAAVTGVAQPTRQPGSQTDPNVFISKSGLHIPLGPNGEPVPEIIPYEEGGVRGTMMSPASKARYDVWYKEAIEGPAKKSLAERKAAGQKGIPHTPAAVPKSGAPSVGDYNANAAGLLQQQSIQRGYGGPGLTRQDQERMLYEQGGALPPGTSLRQSAVPYQPTPFSDDRGRGPLTSPNWNPNQNLDAAGNTMQGARMVKAVPPPPTREQQLLSVLRNSQFPADVYAARIELNNLYSTNEKALDRQSKTADTQLQGDLSNEGHRISGGFQVDAAKESAKGRTEAAAAKSDFTPQQVRAEFTEAFKLYSAASAEFDEEAKAFNKARIRRAIELDPTLAELLPGFKKPPAKK